MKSKNLILLYLFTSTYGVAGDWASSGGKLASNEQNPWFIQNTTEVSYCIDRSDSFGQSVEVVRQRLGEALKYWKDTFKYAESTKSGGVEVTLGTQTFKEVECEESPMVRFQLGTLTDEQRKTIARPQEFVGVAIRTDYDRKKLVGRGFIYIPSANELAANHANIIKDAWALNQGNLLKGVLIHEIGHILGLGHNSGLSLMEETVPNNLVSEGIHLAYLDEMYLPVIIDAEDSKGDRFGNCGNMAGTYTSKAFGIPDEHRCVYIIATSNYDGGYSVWSSIDDLSELTYQGNLHPAYGTGEVFFPKLMVDEVQEVYPELSKKMQAIPASGINTETRDGGTFVDEDSNEKRGVFMLRRNNEIEISPEHEGKLLIPMPFNKMPGKASSR